MRTLATITLVVVPLLASNPSALQAGGGPPQPGPGLPLLAPASSNQPIYAQLATIVDHADTLAGQPVQLPPSRVSKILSSTLVELRDARERGPYRFHFSRKYDKLLVLLPPGVKLSRGDEVILAGRVRTVAGARTSGELTGVGDDVLKERRNRVLVVAAHVATVDGVSLAK